MQSVQKRTVRRVVVCTVIALALLGCIAQILLQQQRWTAYQPPAKTDYEETLVVVADKDYEPYSFFNEKGEPVGYDVEMISAMAQLMEMNVDLRLMSWKEALAAIDSGEADLLLGLEYTPKELPRLALSMPLHNDPFVVFSKSKFSNISELYGKRIAVLENSGSYPLLIEPYQLEQEAIAYGSYSEVFEALEQDQAHFAVARYSVGRRAVARIEHSRIQASGPALASNDFCVGARADNTALIDRFNAALTQSRTDGTLEKLNETWLGRYVEIIGIADFFTRYKDVLAAVGVVLVLLLAAGVLSQYRRRLFLFRQRELELLDRAARDGMTSLYNKLAMEGLVEQIMRDASPQSCHAFLMIDIDNFKLVNDTFGHDFGDAAIMEFAAGIKSVIAPNDLLARLGGDEFGILLHDVVDREMGIQRVDLLVQALKRTAMLGEKKSLLSGSVGVAFYPEHGTDFTTLYQHADEALYRAKRTKKGTFCIYDSEKHSS